MAKKSSKQPKATPKPTERSIDLRGFTNEFFTNLGATVKAADRRKTGALQVDLPQELATYFGAPALTLCFQQAASSTLLTNGQQLIAHGSPIFDKMLSYLDNRSAVAHQRLPVRHNAGEELMRAVRPVNTGIVGLRMHEQTQHLYAFHWHITYRADDKREELYSVLLNEAGERMIASDEQMAIAAPTSTNRVDLAVLLADAEPLPPELNSDGQPVPTVVGARLPPMTQLSRLAETARKYAIYHADLRCVSHETEILPRLYKTLNRLTTYYQQQIEEVYDAHDPTGEKRRVLETDLERKIAEEVENHRLRVHVQLFSYAVLQVPVAVADLTLSDGKREATVQVLRNRYDGTLQRPRCTVCQTETAQIVLDRNGHIICDRCLHQCGSCQDLLCTTCGVAACPVCGQQNCDTCGRMCWACGERACAAHSSGCPVCGDEVCHACQEECSHCGVRQCRSHLRMDHVKEQRGVTAYICADCALRCPGCEQYSAEVGLCSASGQRFCQNCLVACAGCQRAVGPGFYQVIDHAPYCHTCLVECPSCHSWTATIQACAQCQTSCCHTCGATCALCQQRFCPDHSTSYTSCDHIVCQTHTAHCAHCTEELCPLCSEVCAICERHYCTTHDAICAGCGQRYCQSCVTESERCTTCTALATEGIAIDLTQEPCIADERVARIAADYRWTYAQNTRYRVYRGQPEQQGQDAQIVVNTSAEGVQVVSVTGQGIARTRRQAAIDSKLAEQERIQGSSEWLHEFQEWLRRMRRSGRDRR